MSGGGGWQGNRADGAEGGGGKATGVGGAEGPAGGGWRGRVGGIGDGGGWQDGADEETGADSLALTGWRGGSALETVMDFSIFRHILPKAQRRTRFSLSRTPFRYNTAKNSPVSYRRKLKIGIASLFR